MCYVILCFIGESFGWLKALSSSKRAISFLMEGKLNPNKVTNFHFTGMTAWENKNVVINLRSLFPVIFNIKPYLPPFNVK